MADNRDNVVDQTEVVGSIAHDAVDSGKPVKIGAKAKAHGSDPTAVADADRSDLLCNRDGILFVIGGHPNVVAKEFHITAAKTDADLLGTISAGTKVVVTKCSAVISKATTVNVGVRIGFGATTIPATADAGTGAAGLVLSHSGIAPGSGVVEGNGSAIIGVGADGEELRITSDVPTTGSLRILVNYFTIES
jgi:hypothetical protein